MSSIADRPAWDDTPLRSRPPALRGLLAAEGVSAREPWARDECVYNRRFSMWSDYDGHFNLEARAPYSPHRTAMSEIHKEAYMGRWLQKFEIGVHAAHRAHRVVGDRRERTSCACCLQVAAGSRHLTATRSRERAPRREPITVRGADCPIRRLCSRARGRGRKQFT